MANNRDRKLNEHEETEYHFSDEGMTYDAESEEQSAPQAEPPKPTRNFLSDLSTQKRIGISVVAFLILLFIVYKIVSPGGNKNNIAPLAAETPIRAPSQAELAAAVKAAPTPPAPTAQPVNQVPAQQPMMTQQQPMAPMQGSSVSSVPAQPMTQESAQQNALPPTNQMPPVMQVTSAPPTYPASSPTVESGANQLNTINNQLVTQMQNDYTQKLADVSQQNKRLEDEVQKLNASVTNIEARMNQLVQFMVNQQNEKEQIKAAGPVQSAASGTKLPYTVQAIIPGRAWLRADNGDTVTVTEGDTIKDIGRVTKIDPYDGVIEINTGRKVVSLSYGNGG